MTKKGAEPVSVPAPIETAAEPAEEAKPTSPVKAEEKSAFSPVNEEKKTEEPVSEETTSATAEEEKTEKTTSVQDEETITSPNTIEATLDGVVGDMLNNIRLCCSPASAMKATTGAPLAPAAVETEETKVP